MTGIAAGIACLLAVTVGWVVPVGVGVLAAIVGITRPTPAKMSFALALVFAASVAGAARHEPPLQPAIPGWLSVADAVRGTVARPPTNNGTYQQVVLRVDEIVVDGRSGAADGTICVAARRFPAASLGDRVWLAGKFDRPEDQALSIQSWIRARGCGGSVFASRFAIEEAGHGWRRSLSLLRNRMSTALQQAAPGDAGVLLSGFVTGDDDALSDARHDAFVRTSTVHLTAVSGANLALLVTILAGAGGVLGISRRLGWQLVVVGGVWLYALLVGLEPPALRAAAVASAAVLAVRFGRKPDFVTLIVLAAAAEVLARPQDVWSLSFRLSVAASLALVLVMGGAIGARRANWLTSAIVATAVAQLATLPILLPVFGTVTLAGIPANVLVAAPAEFAFIGGAASAVAGAIWYPLGETLAVPARLSAALVIAIVDRIGSAHWIAQPVGTLGSVPTLLLTVGVVVAVGWASPDVRRWAERSVHGSPWGQIAARPRFGWLSLVGGVVVGLLLTVLI